MYEVNLLVKKNECFNWVCSSNDSYVQLSSRVIFWFKDNQIDLNNWNYCNNISAVKIIC